MMAPDAGSAPATELWFTERQTPDLALSLRVTRTLWQETTPYQELLVAETAGFGRLLALGGTVQLTERDEFFYHEMLAHVPLAVHPAPRRVLVIGGGDGGTVREALRHPEVERVDLVEIDEAVVRAGRAYFPALAGALDDARVRVHVADGIAFVEDAPPASYDVVLVDSTDPVGPAVGLFRAPFFAAVRRALGPDGILVAQSESPLLHGELIAATAGEMARTFARVSLYLCPVPTYPSGQWSFLAACDRGDPARPLAGREVVGARYYTPAVHRAAFELPPYAAAHMAGVGR
jgi:spermidine synthase